LNSLLFFSNNSDKIKEIKNIFKNLPFKILSPKDFGLINEPNEVGKSFSENAKIKSFFGYKKINLPCFADDSGISIEALGWKPNIFSKRFINSFKNKNHCFDYIINKVAKNGKNKAYFKTSVCLTFKKNYHIVFEGRVLGKISSMPLGQKGFGYDPIFIPDGYSKTFGQINKNEKNKISHRSIAINKLISFLVK